VPLESHGEGLALGRRFKQETYEELQVERMKSYWREPSAGLRG